METTLEQFQKAVRALSDQHLIDAAERELRKLCQSGAKSFRMSVPPQIYDTDILFGEVIRRLTEKSQTSPT